MPAGCVAATAVGCGGVSRSGRSLSVNRFLPSASQIPSVDPNWVNGTKYENGFFTVVTRNCASPGAMLTPRIRFGQPTLVTRPSRTSISASWPVVRCSRSFMS